jgi:hypothetical protein
LLGKEGAMVAKMVAWLPVAAIAVAVAYAAAPRSADLRGFDPAGMARLETAMWRDYYERHYPSLFYHLYESSRTQFGFSPLDSVRIALSAAQAAKTFQPTHSRGAAASRRLLQPAARRGTVGFRAGGNRKSRARLVAGTT